MELEHLVEKQKNYFYTNQTKGLKFRLEALRRLDMAVRKYEKEILKALKEDLHKSEVEAMMTEVGMTLKELAYVRKHLAWWSASKPVFTPMEQFAAVSYSKAEPYGSVLIMAPWNYPFLLCMEPLIGALAAGNCCVVKPSAYAPHTSAVVKKILESIFPQRFVAVVEGGREANMALLNQRFDYIFFTGSVDVGRLVMKKAAKYLIPVTLELGGKSPCIVERSANLDLTAKRIVFGKFLNSGQTCVAPDYILADQEIKDELVHRLKKWIRIMYGKRPLLSPDYPKMINKRHYQRVMGLMEGELIAAGGYGNPDTLQIAPTVLDEVTEDSSVMQEEIFGPVLPVLAYCEVTDAVRFVKKREKPLALYLFTRNKKAEKFVLYSLSFGGGCVNDTVTHLATSRLPFGGVGQSGMGSYHGRESFLTFSHCKGIVKKSNLVDLPIRYQPYTKSKENLVRRLLM